MLESSVLVDYVAVICTHNPLLIPLKWFSEVFGWTLSRLHWRDGWQKVDQT